MSVISIPLAIQEERARRAGVPLEVWQTQSNRRVANMRVQAHRQVRSNRVIDIAELSESQRKALRRMSLAFCAE